MKVERDEGCGELLRGEVHNSDSVTDTFEGGSNDITQEAIELVMKATETQLSEMIKILFS